MPTPIPRLPTPLRWYEHFYALFALPMVWVLIVHLGTRIHWLLTGQ